MSGSKVVHFQTPLETGQMESSVIVESDFQDFLGTDSLSANTASAMKNSAEIRAGHAQQRVATKSKLYFSARKRHCGKDLDNST